MEDFLQLAKENTEKDLETCGTLGAFLVRFMRGITIFSIPIVFTTQFSFTISPLAYSKSFLDLYCTFICMYTFTMF